MNWRCPGERALGTRRLGRARTINFAGALGALALASSAAAAGSAGAAGLASDKVPADIIAACEAAARPFGAFDAAVETAIGDLDALGVLLREDFSGVRIGFCPLAAHDGPVATTACAADVILLDAKYAGPGAGPLLRSTLAHEMRHVRQHRARRAQLGPGYCAGADYRGERAALEAEAEAFGDETAALFFVGRPIAIRNDCPVAIRLYLEGEGLAGAGGAPAGPFIAPARSTAPIGAATTSRHIRFYALSEPKDSRRWVWRAAQGADRRFIGGRTVGLKPMTLAAPRAPDAPFRLVLSCP